MDNKKFEQLIDLIINEDEDKAKALFHDIVVEKSREIYENMMEEEEDEEDDEEETVEEGLSINVEETGHSGDQVEGLMSEIGAEEEGMTEEDDEFADIDVDGEEAADDMDDMGGEAGEEELEDRVVELEDKLDELMAEFEEMMGKDSGEEDMGDEEGAEEMGGEEGEEAGEEGEEEGVMEAVQLQKVSVTHGDNGQNTKSPVSGGPKVSGNGAKAVNAFGGDEKGGKAQAPKTIPGTYKNAPGQKGQDLAAAPKPKHGDDGQNTKSPLGESKKSKKSVK
jgi:hypothetical protein